MKKILGILLTIIILSACNDNFDDDLLESVNTQNVTIALSYPETSSNYSKKDVTVVLTDNNGGYFTALTDEDGNAHFEVPAGIYSASVSNKQGISIYNGGLNNIIVSSNGNLNFEIKLLKTTINPLIIKEFYCGGCQMDDGSSYTRNDKYVIIYNNSNDNVEIDNFSLGIITPYNSSGTNNNYINGELIYQKEEFTPAAMGIWYYPGMLKFSPYEQKVISIYGAIDHTKTYSNSVNLANKDYYVLYDEANGRYTDTHYYPAPYSEIPHQNYFNAIVYGLGTCWVVSVTSPGLFIFSLDENPVTFADNEENHFFDGGKSGSWGAYGSCLKIPNNKILDAIEVFTTRFDDNKKRFTPDIDGGYVWHTNQYGYTLYRNVDKEATESLPENSGKLVYNYNLGTNDIEHGSTDLSGIDAEASIKNGAHIIYLNTNNSTNDFHQRKIASIKN